MNKHVSEGSKKAVASLRKAAAFIDRHAEEIVGTPHDAYVAENGVKLEIDLTEAYSGVVILKYSREILIVER